MFIYQIDKVYWHLENEAAELAATTEHLIEALIGDLRTVTFAGQGQVGEVTQSGNGSHDDVIKRTVIRQAQFFQLQS